MKCLLRHILLAATLLCQMCISVSCSSDTDDVHDPGIVSGVAMFVVNTEIMGASRNADSGIVPDCELIHTLRIVILHADGTVEHNRYYSLEDARAQKSIILKVRSNEKKKIFLFANEESVSAIEGVTDSRTLTLFFDGYSDDSPGFADAVDGLYFAPDYSDGKPVPMSSMYELEPFEGRAEKTFHLVRVATKFTVNFMNWRGEDVTVDSFTIAKHADKSFLMAHVNNSEQNRILFNGKSWIEWLKKVSDASYEGDSYDKTEAAGWLKDYELPTQACNTKEYTYNEKVIVKKSDFDIDRPDMATPGVADNPPVFYLPESRNLKAGATDGEQEYTMTINIAGRTEPFVFTLPNLKALFRNTHAVVNITLLNSMEIIVDVIPYSNVELEPDFGL